MLTTDKFPLLGFPSLLTPQFDEETRNFHRTFLSEFTRDKTTNEYSSSLSYIYAAFLIHLFT